MTQPSSNIAGGKTRLRLASLGAGGVPLVADDEALVCVNVAIVDSLRVVGPELLVADVILNSEEDNELELIVLGLVTRELVLDAPSVPEVLDVIVVSEPVDGMLATVPDVAVLSEDVASAVSVFVDVGLLDEGSLLFDCAV